MGEFCVHLEETIYSECSSVTRTIVYTMSIFDLLSRMKINMESHDACTLLHLSIFEKLRQSVSRKQYHRIAAKVVAAIVFFGSASFMTNLEKEVAQLTANTFNIRLKHIIASTERSWRVFTNSFNPNRIRRNRVLKAKREGLNFSLLPFRMWKAWIAKKHMSALKLTVGRAVFSRRMVASRLGRTFGSFSCKNALQILRRAYPTARCFKKAIYRDMYSETGPGCRASINMLMGLPKTWNIYKTGQQAADVYNVHLMQILKMWRKIVRECFDCLPSDLQLHAEYFLNCEEVDVQFLLCELSKIIAFLEFQNEKYTRGYWTV